MTPMQIMIAVAVRNQRPPTKGLEQEWGESVVRVMRQLWSADPAARPSMIETKAVLHPEAIP